jgi:hypothetical protein
MEKTAVLPVPDCDWAITSWPWVMGRIARCWIADGFSKPEYTPRGSRLVSAPPGMFSKCRPFPSRPITTDHIFRPRASRGQTHRLNRLFFFSFFFSVP